MRTNVIVASFILVCIGGIVAVPNIWGQDSQELILKNAEARLRAIYEGGEFRSKRFRADWLPDSSGYTILEPVPESEEQVLVRYDVASGKRTVLDSPQKEEAGRSGSISPGGRRLLYLDQG
ncbi:MAG: hypothetical protein IIC50_25555, partial [Planctomycetes bacterium]|nr:hypothetical protein [Planctomycetota bacterium]